MFTFDEIKFKRVQENGIKPRVIRDRLMVQFVRNGIIYATEDHWIFQSHDKGSSWQKVCKLKKEEKSLFGSVKDHVLRSEIIRHLRRNIGINNVVVLKSGTILIQYDGIYRYDGNGTYADRVFDFKRDNIIGPLKNGFMVNDETDNIYFGEYNNNRPYAVRIFRGTNDGRNWSPCYRFSKGRIKHVHSIVPDPFRNRIWICAGDNNQETGLFYTEDDFKTVHLFGGGDQSWRMVSLIPKEDAIYWGSDAGSDASSDFQNFIYMWDFRKNKRRRLTCIDKPAYYSAFLSKRIMVIGSTYEPLIERDVEKSADLWISNNGEKWGKLISLSFHPSKRSSGTKYATICLPLGDGSVENIFFTPLNVEKYDFKLMSVEPV